MQAHTAVAGDRAGELLLVDDFDLPGVSAEIPIKTSLAADNAADSARPRPEQPGRFGDANAGQSEQSRSPTPVGRVGLPSIRRSRTVGGWWACRIDDTAGSQAAAPKR